MVFPRAVLFAVFTLSIAWSSFAVTRTWTGATSANWSDPTNWSPAGVPDVSDTLVLGSNNSQHSDMNNDLPPGTRIGPISIPVLSSFSISGNPLVLTGSVTGDSFARWNADLKMEADVTLPGIAFSGALDVNGHAVTLHLHPTQQFNSPPALISGPISGTGSLTINGTRFKITQASTFSGTFHVQNVCELDASMPNANVIVEFGELDGNGTIGNLSSGAGDVSPGVNPFPQFGILHTKSLSLDGGYVANVGFFNPISDKLDVTGTVRLSGPLFPVLGIPVTPPPLGREVVIIENDGSDPVVGTFQGLPEGGLILADGYTMRISYQGGDGNDVTLTDIAYGKLWTQGCSNKWSDACNWSPASVPEPGEVIDFGAHQAGGLEPINDLPAGLAIGGLTVNGYSLTGNPITLLGDINSGPLGGQVAMPITLGATVHLSCPFFGPIDVNGHTLLIDGLTQIGELNGSGTVSNGGSLQVSSGSFTGSLSGFLAIGPLPNASITGVSHLSGFVFDAKVADITIEAGGTIDPGPLPGVFFGSPTIGTISATSLSLAGTYNCDISGNVVDSIIVTGPVSLSGPLNLVMRKSGQTASSFTIIDNRGAAPVSGTFTGLPEGASVQAGGSTFTISYRGGDGNDVVLLSGPAPMVTLAQSAVATAFGEPATITATVTGSVGAVVFSDGLTELGRVSPDHGVATFDIRDLGVGTHVITAAFGPATATVTHTVHRGTTNVIATASSIAGQAFAVAVTVQAVSPAVGIPAGLLTVEIDGTRVGTAPLLGGTATISTGVLSFGRHTIAAHYGGDAGFEPGDGGTEVVIAPVRGRSVRH
jgi:hypothetical protein